MAVIVDEEPAVARQCRPYWPGGPLAGALFGSGLALFDLMVLANVHSHTRAAIGIPLMLLAPGLLLLNLIGPRTRMTDVEYVTASVGLSIALLMFGTLALSELLPSLGISRPLGVIPLLVLVNCLNLPPLFWPILRQGIGGPRLGRIAISRVPTSLMSLSFGLSLWTVIRQRWRLQSPLEKALVFPCLLLPTLALLGATSLNNNGSRAPTASMLVLVVALIVIVSASAGRPKDCALAWLVFSASLSLLLMNSMRSWHVLGGDINGEYFVFMNTLRLARWSPNLAASPEYNACLSITVLPTALSALLGVSPEYIFKFVMQLPFAITPVIVFAIARRFSDRAPAFMAAMLYAGQTWFSEQMTALIRQEIAAIFLGLAIMVLLDSKLTTRDRRWLFATWSAGIVVSHYSTAYYWLSVLLLGSLFTRAMRAMQWRRLSQSDGAGDSRTQTTPISSEGPDLQGVENFGALGPVHRLLQSSAAGASHLFGRRSLRLTTHLTLGKLLLVASLIVFWDAGVTTTYHSFSRLVSQLHSHAADALSPGSLKDSAVQLAFSTPNQDYSGQLRAAFAARETQFKDKPDFHGYPLGSPSDSAVPPTENDEQVILGPRPLVVAVQGASKVTKFAVVYLFPLLGLGFVFAKAIRFADQGRAVLHRDLASMGAANLPLLAVALSVPVMRESFNLTRLFQSAMFLLALPAVWGGLGLFGHLARRGSRLPLALVISAFVCYSIGLTSQVVGGVAHSSLNAPGPAFNAYYITDGEVAAAAWLRAYRDPAVPVYADPLTGVRLRSFGDLPDPVDTLFQPAIDSRAYVYAGYTNLKRGIAYVDYSGQMIPFRFPEYFLAARKSVVFQSGEAKVFR